MFNFANIWVPITYVVLLIILGGATWLLLGIFQKPSEKLSKDEKKAAQLAKKAEKASTKGGKKAAPAFAKAKTSNFPEPAKTHVFGNTDEQISLGGEVSETENGKDLQDVDADSILGISSTKGKAKRAEDAIIPSSLFDRLSDDD